MEFKEIKALIGAELEAKGWALTEEPALANKGFLTTSGERYAQAYLQNWGPESHSWVLSGHYRSEGRNQLEPYSVLIPKTATLEEAATLVAKFDTDVDTVANSLSALKVLGPATRARQDRLR